MSENSYSWPMLSDTTRALQTLATAVHELTAGLPRPELRGPAGDEWFQFQEQDQGPNVVAVLRCVRIVSGLRAAMRLGESGFTQEMGVLFRTVDDFIDEITFLLEGYRQDPPAPQATRFVQHFFQEGILSKEQLLADKQGIDRVKKKKIRAAQGRLMDPEDPDTSRRQAGAIDFVWDGYVHGGYPAIMEMYNGHRGQFHLNGMARTIRVYQYRRHLALYVYRALAVTAVVAAELGLKTVSDGLAEAARVYMNSDEYPRED